MPPLVSVAVLFVSLTERERKTLSIQRGSAFYACFFRLRASMAAVFVPAIAKEATFSPRPGESRVPVAPLPPAVPIPTAVPPTLSQQAIWRQMGRGGWRAAWHRS